MDIIQEKLLGLLKRIDETCRHHSLTYYLGNETALSAVRWGCFPENCVGASVYMPADSYDSFEELTSSNPDVHTVESMMTNRDFPFTFLHYVDKDTTRINMSMIGLQNHPGIAVKIMKLIPYTPRKNNEQLRDKIALAALMHEETFGATVKYPKNYDGSRIEEIRNDPELALEIYRSNLDLKGTDKDKYYLQQYRAAAKTFNKDIFGGDPIEVSLEGEKFMVPHDYSGFLSSLYGRRWLSRDITFKPYSSDFIVDIDNPYSLYMSTTDALQEDAQIYRRVKREKAPIAARTNELRMSLEKQNIYFDRSVDRFRCMDEYLPEKKRIMAMYKKGDFEGLFFTMNGYQLTTEKYLKQKLPFAFDKDMYIIMGDMLEWQGLPSLREQLDDSREDAFKYLDEVFPSNQHVLDGSLYSYDASEHCMKKKNSLFKKTVAMTTDEDMDRLHRELGRMEERNGGRSDE